MDLLQLQYFRTIAHYENITKAAQALFVSQPNLSASMSRLEDDLAVKLFERRRGKISLTANGQLFLEYVERALRELDDGIERVRAEEKSVQNSIRVVGSQMDFVSEILQKQYSGHDQIRIKQIRCANLDVYDRILSDHADFGFFFGTPKTNALEYSPMHTAERVAVVHADHPLAKRGRISLFELSEENFICNYCRDDAELFAELERSFDFKPRTFYECDDTGMEAAMISIGNAVSITPLPNYCKFVREQPELNIVFLRIEEQIPFAQIGIVRRRGNRLSPSALEFLQHVKTFFRMDAERVDSYLEHPSDEKNNRRLT